MLFMDFVQTEPCAGERHRVGRSRRSAPLAEMDRRSVGGACCRTTQVFPNCSRYNPQDEARRTQRVRSEETGRDPPIPDWKRMTWAQELPAGATIRARAAETPHVVRFHRSRRPSSGRRNVRVQDAVRIERPLERAIHRDISSGTAHEVQIATPWAVPMPCSALIDPCRSATSSKTGPRVTRSSSSADVGHVDVHVPVAGMTEHPHGAPRSGAISPHALGHGPG